MIKWIEGSGENENFVGELVMWMTKIKDNSDENIALNMWWTQPI